MYLAPGKVYTYIYVYHGTCPDLCLVTGVTHQILKDTEVHQRFSNLNLVRASICLCRHVA